MQADNLLLAFAITDGVACLMPGPAVMAVMGIALTGSLRGMIGAIAGINLGNMIWYIMVGAGLVALAHSLPHLFTVLRWAGIAYLFWLGIKSLQSHVHLTASKRRAGLSAWQGLTSGLAVQLSNPKAMVFFTVFLPPFIDLRRPVAPQIITLSAIGVTLEVLALIGYGLLAYRLGQVALSPEAEKWIGRVSGAIFMAIAVGMALTHA